MSNLTTKKEIRYLNKDFSDFRENLINFAKTYFQNTFNDFDPADPAMMFIEMSAYVGDVLSYYIDKQIKEMLLLHAEERKNVVQLAQSLGYKPRPTVPAKVNLDVYQIIPSIGSGQNVKPDWRYALNIDEGMQISSEQDSNIVFRTLDNINFAQSGSSPTEVSIYSIESGEPTYYLLKKTVYAEAGTQLERTFDFGEPKKYEKVVLPDTDIISIDNIVDSDGNVWYEVPYLAQDTVFKAVVNTTSNDPDLSEYKSQTPWLLKLVKVPKRFITRYRSDNKLELQFGSGIVSNLDEEVTPNPDNVGMMTPTGISKLNYAWNITNFLYTDAYGESPNNTTLTVKYSVGGGLVSNVLVNTLTKINEISFTTIDLNLNSNVVGIVKDSIAVNNSEAANGGRDSETEDEIRHNALSYFAAQDRAVTKDDYVIRTMSMPAKFGSVAKAFIIQDTQLMVNENITEEIDNPLTLNMYVLAFDANKKLAIANRAIKENLSNYIDKYRMLTDSINIKDAYIINIGVIFDITILPDYNAKEIIIRCIDNLKNHFSIDKWQINQPIIKADIIRNIANTSGVQSVIKVEVVNLFDVDLGYSGNIYDINAATRNDIIYPSLDPSIFEIKFPDVDIRGKTVTY